MPAQLSSHELYVVQAIRASVHRDVLVHDEWRAADCRWPAGVLLYIDQEPAVSLAELAGNILDLWVLFVRVGLVCVVLASWWVSLPLSISFQAPCLPHQPLNNLIF